MKPYVTQQIKSKDAEKYWRKIGKTIRYVYGSILSDDGEPIARKKWEDLPLGIRSRLSREMNRLQGRRNKQVKPLDKNDRKQYGILALTKQHRPSDKISQKTWDALYYTGLNQKRARKVRRLVMRTTGEDKGKRTYVRKKK